MNNRNRFIVIFLVLAISFTLIWPNIAVRSLVVRFNEDLSVEDTKKTLETLKQYLKTNYNDRYTWEVKDEVSSINADPEAVNKVLKDGIKPTTPTKKNSVFYIYGRSIQVAFINEIARITGVDAQRTELLPIWIEENLKAKVFKLGLDLQGGMNLILEGDFEKLQKDLNRQYPPEYIADLQKKITAEKDPKKRKDLEDENEKIASIINLNEDKRKEYMEGALEIIRSRIDKTGVSEPLIRIQNNNRIEISLPGVASPEHAKKLIKSTAKVSYHLSEKDPAPFTTKAAQYFEEYKKLDSDDSRESFLQETEKKIGLSSDLGIYVAWNKIPNDIKKRMEPEYFMVLERQESLSGNHITPNTYVGFNPDALQNTINFTLTSEGSRKFAEVTTKNIGRRMAIVIDNKILSAPNINEPILTGSAQISGSFDPEEAKDLALIIKEGALPVPMNIVEERTLGPSLGKESIHNGFKAIALGLFLVCLFMLVYYHTAGIIANITLLLNIPIMGAILALMDFTITLPGLTGIVLTLGIAVDSNVIIYERIREEISKGRSFKVAVSTGFERAMLTIVDSNITTIIAAIVLSQFGTGPIKGFAITLFIGILSSMFTALYVCKTMFYSLAYDMNVKSISMGFGKYRSVLQKTNSKNKN